MTFDEVKAYAKEMIALCGDSDDVEPNVKAAIVVAIITQAHVQMPSDIEHMNRLSGAGSPVLGASLVPRIG